jgi:hypothetical protein
MKFSEALRIVQRAPAGAPVLPMCGRLAPLRMQTLSEARLQHGMVRQSAATAHAVSPAVEAVQLSISTEPRRRAEK